VCVSAGCACAVWCLHNTLINACTSLTAAAADCAASISTALRFLQAFVGLCCPLRWLVDSSAATVTAAAPAVVLQGQGLQILPSADGTMPIRAAVNCWAGSTGMAQDTVMFNARPCDTYPRFMTTEQPLASSRSACKATAGYTAVNGSQPIAAVACDIGSYKAVLGNEACTLCPGNSSTPSIASISVDNCTGESVKREQICRIGFC
jgi:hypothetical protein